MARNLIAGGVLALALALPATAVAGGSMPRAALAKKADAICAAHDKQRAANPNPPTYADPGKASVKQMKASAPWFARSYAIQKDEIAKVFALGQPSEPAAQTAWKRLRFLMTKVVQPSFARAVAAAQRGDGKGFMAEVVKTTRYDAEQQKLEKAIGLKVCGSDG